MKTKNLLPLAAAVMLFGLTVMLQACSDESDDPIPAGWIYWDDDPDPNDTTLVRDYLIFDGFFMVKPNLVHDYRCIQVFPDRCSSVWRSCSDTIPGYAELIWYDTVRCSRKKIFSMVAEHNGDTSFSSSVAHYDVVKQNQWLRVGIMLEDVIDIQVTAVDDYDAAHLAGSSLTEMAHVSYCTVYPFVRNGYVFDQWSTGAGFYPACFESAMATDDDIRSCFHANPAEGHAMRELMHNCLASEIPSAPLRMVQGTWGFWLSLDSMPDREWCTVEVSITVQLPGGEYSARTLSQTYKVGPMARMIEE